MDTAMCLAIAEDPSHDMLMTIVTALAAGVMLIVIARKFGIPAIVLLLLGGVALGPAVWEGLFGLEAPVRPGELGEHESGLRVIVALAIGLILFEGGLTLDVTGYRSAPKVIKRLLTIGVLVTWVGTAIVVRLIFDVEWKVAIIAGSLVIVTGPTVIAPLLKRITIKQKLHSILHWEGVLIDPIGVFIALLCYEFVVGESGPEAVVAFFVRLGWGMVVGISGGILLSYCVRKRLVVEEMVNVFALGFAVAVFGLAEWAKPEAGLLAVTVAGFVFGLTTRDSLKQVRQFKAEITDLLIGLLFILLAARLDLEQFIDFGWKGVAAVACMMLIIRPLGIFLSSIRTELNTRERIFLSWIAPRGIVAASMASLIALNLGDRFVETFTYSVIVATIVLQGSTAGLLARVLDLERTAPTGWLIVGAHAFSRRLANFLKYKADRKVVLIDTNDRAVRETRSQGLSAMTGDARDTALYERNELHGIGNILALTDNEDLNVRICQNWSEILGEKHVFRCDPAGASIDEKSNAASPPGISVWPRLPRPSLIATELAQGEAEFIEAEGDRPAGAPSALPIAHIHKGVVAIDVQEEDVEQGSLSEGKTLYLLRKADYLLRAVRPELILDLDPPANLRDLFTIVVERMVRVQPKLSRDRTVQELLDRESAFPTLLGNQIAVPHSFSEGINSRLCAIARLSAPMRFGTGEHDGVDLAFLLISPQGDPEGHLATLAEIARMLIRPEMKSRILEAGSPLEVIRLIRESGKS